MAEHGCPRRPLWIAALLVLPVCLPFSSASGRRTSLEVFAGPQEEVRCPQCGVPGKPGQKFCGECGQKINTEDPSKCRGCGTQNSPGQKFCAGCGAKLVPPVPAEGAPKRFTHPVHGFSFELPAGWTMREEGFQLGINGTLLELGRAPQIQGLVACDTSDLKPEAYAQNCVKSIERASDATEILHESRRKAGGVRIDFRATKGRAAKRYALIVSSHASKIYFLILLASDAGWKDEEGRSEAVLESFSFGTEGPAVTPAVKPGEVRPPAKTASPWDGCKAGSWVKYRVRSESGGAAREMDVTYVLVDPGDGTYYVMRADMVLDGREYKGRESRVELANEPPSETASGDEAVQVPKGEYRCAKSESRSGETRTTFWKHPEVPFRIVQRIDETPAGKSTSVLLDYSVVK